MSFLADAFTYFTPKSTISDIEFNESDHAATCAPSWDEWSHLKSKFFFDKQIDPQDSVKDDYGSPMSVQTKRTKILESKSADCLKYLEPPRIVRTVRSSVSLSEWRDLHTEKEESVIDTQSLFSRSTMDMALDEVDFLIPDVNAYDEDTVIVSNKLLELKSSDCDHNISTKKHTSLKEYFDINLSAPLDLCRCKKVSYSSTPLLHGQFTFQEKSISSSRSINAISSEHSEKRITLLFRNKFEPRNQILGDKEQFLLIGAHLNNYRYMSTRKIIKKRCKTNDPAKKVEMILNRKPPQATSHRSGIVGVVTECLGMKNRNKFKGIESQYTDLDVVVKGRLDGIDILSFGSLKRPLSITSAQRWKLSSKIVHESLWLQSGRRTSVVVFEGLTGSSKGADRWTVPINKVESNVRRMGYDDMKHENNIDQLSNGLESNVFDSPSINVNSIDQLRLSYNSAIAPLMFGDLKRSIEIMKKICIALGKQFKDSSKRYHVIGSTHHNLSNIFLLDNNLEEALVHINIAISFRIRCLGYYHESVAVSVAKAGLIYFGLGRLGRAINAFEQALRIKRYLYSNDQIDVAKILNNLSLVNYCRGRKKKATQLLFRALKIQEHYANSSLCRDYIICDISTILSNIGRIYLDRGQHTMSTFFYEEVLEYQLMVWDKHHIDVLDSLNNIAYVKLHEGDKTNAMTIYKALYRLQVSQYGSKSHQAINTLCMMGLIMIHQSNFSAALRCLIEVLEWQQVHLDHYDPRIKNTETIVSRLKIVVNGEVIST